MQKLFDQTLVIVLALCIAPKIAAAADLKILDSSGLIRAVRVVRDASTVTVSITDPKKASGDCLATNVDGIASERREPVNSKGECVFRALAAGTWQIRVANGARWRVRIDE